MAKWETDRTWFFKQYKRGIRFIKGHVHYHLLIALSAVFLFDVLFFGLLEKWPETPLLNGTSVRVESLSGTLSLLGFTLASIVFLKSRLSTGSFVIERDILGNEIDSLLRKVGDELTELERLIWDLPASLDNAKHYLEKMKKLFGPVDSILLRPSRFQKVKPDPLESFMDETGDLTFELVALQKELRNKKKSTPTFDSKGSELTVAKLEAELDALFDRLNVFRGVAGASQGGLFKKVVVSLVLLSVMGIFLATIPLEALASGFVRFSELSYVGVLVWTLSKLGQVALYILRM